MSQNEVQSFFRSGSTARCSPDEIHNNITGRPKMDDSDAEVPHNVETGSDLTKQEANLTRKKLLVVGAILSTELCERLTYFSVISNMVLFCQSTLEYDDETATVISMVFSGCVYIVPVFGGYIADAVAGKFSTIFGSGLLYLIGLVLLPVSAVQFRDWFGQDSDGQYYDLSLSARRTYFILGLAFVAIGTGGIKPNVGLFGAEQVRDIGEKAVTSFFNWFYWFVNAGAIVAFLAVAYVQQNIGFDYGFLIPLLSMLLALIIFFAARNLYIVSPPGGSVLLDAINVCVYGRRRAGSCLSCFIHAKESNGGKYSDSYVDGIKSIIKALPIFGCFTMFSAIYFQMATTFFLQSERINIMIGSFKLPAAMLNVFDTIVVLLLIPFVDRIVFPLFEKLGKPLSHLHRIGIGFVFAAFAMVTAGVVEIYRKQNLEETGGIIQELGDKSFNASKMTVFVQVPQFAFIGASEVFAGVSGLEFAYSQAPKELQGVLMGIFFTTAGLGAYMSTVILKITVAASAATGDDWLPKDINNGYAEYYFFMLGALTLFFLAVFTLLAKLMYSDRKSAEVPTDYSDKSGLSMSFETENKTEQCSDFVTVL